MENNNYKEKYESLIEAIKVLRDINLSDSGIQNWVNDYVPELAESEDEKIKKTLIRFFKDQYPNETEMYDGSVTVGKAIAWLEKQGEQKPVWGGEDEQYLLVCRNALAKYQITDKWDANIIYNWLKNKLQR